MPTCERADNPDSLDTEFSTVNVSDWFGSEPRVLSVVDLNADSVSDGQTQPTLTTLVSLLHLCFVCLRLEQALDIVAGQANNTVSVALVTGGDCPSCVTV